MTVGAFELLEIWEIPDLSEELERSDVDRFKVEMGDSWIGDFDRGDEISGGETLLLLDVGGLDDQKREMFSLAQAGILKDYSKMLRCFLTRSCLVRMTSKRVI